MNDIVGGGDSAGAGSQEKWLHNRWAEAGRRLASIDTTVWRAALLMIEMYLLTVEGTSTK